MPPVLFRDADYVVLNKPAGLAVHAGPQGRASVEDWFQALSRRRTGPWLAHRLDADTAGCLVVALRKPALLEAQAAFSSGLAEKVYWAVVRGRPDAPGGTVNAPLAKCSTPAGWRMVADPAAPPATTDWRWRGEADGLSWLELRPRTGRTHQVRAHCALLGCPVVGDPVYGGGGGTLHLLARAIALPTQPPLAAVAPPPGHMIVALTACGYDAAADPTARP